MQRLTSREPQVLPWRALYTALVIVLITQLANRVTRMQESLREQRSRLRKALAEVRLLAECDELTRLPNRRTTAGALQRALALTSGNRPIGCVAILDIDHFKRINDQQGHAAGDDVLRRFARICRSSIRDGDHVGRWGGEEFLLFMPLAEPVLAGNVVQRLRAAVAQEDFGTAGIGVSVTFSAGIAEHGANEAVEACIARADLALYGAKHAGRDRAVFAPAIGPPVARDVATADADPVGRGATGDAAIRLPVGCACPSGLLPVTTPLSKPAA